MRNHDFSEYMTTGPLLRSAWLLAGGSVGVLVNTAKPSIRGLYAFGRMGRLHDLLYDLDCIALYSDLYGIYPSCVIGGKTYYPFRSGADVRSAGSFDISGEKTVTVSEAENSLSFGSVPMYEKGAADPGAVLKCFGIRTDGCGVTVEADFPDGAEECRLHLPWYPLYDSFAADGGEKRKIQYYRHGIYGIYPDHLTVTAERSVLLSDTLSRQASVGITAEGGRILLCGRTREEYGNALYLSSDVVSHGGKIRVGIELSPPSAAVSGAFYYPCGTEADAAVTREGTSRAGRLCRLRHR